MTTTNPVATKLARVLRERPSDFSAGQPNDYHPAMLARRLRPEYMTVMVGGPAPFAVTFNDAEFVLEMDRRHPPRYGVFIPWLEIVNHSSYGHPVRTDTPWADITVTLSNILPSPL